MQDSLKDLSLPIAVDIPDTHIAVMAGRVRGAIALIDKSSFSDDKKKTKAILYRCAARVCGEKLKYPRSQKLCEIRERFHQNFIVN